MFLAVSLPSSFSTIFERKRNLKFVSLLIFSDAGHFLLTNLLLDNMKNTARDCQKEGRIVNVASEGHRFPYSEGIRFDKINDEAR